MSTNDTSSRSVGYFPDEPLNRANGDSILAHACVWLVDEKMSQITFDRVKEYLPVYRKNNNENEKRQENCNSNWQTANNKLKIYKDSDNNTDGITVQVTEEGKAETIEDKMNKAQKATGINRRWRFYRYIPGRYYRPHIDGAWPASGIDSEGKYVYDVNNSSNPNGFNNKPNQIFSNSNEDASKERKKKQRKGPQTSELSRLTFLIYLNDDFEGGCTTFFTPSAEEEGKLNAFPVKPVIGSVLVFPHGDTQGSLLHEGSPVLSRAKYVVRTDVLYPL